VLSRADSLFALAKRLAKARRHARVEAKSEADAKAREAELRATETAAAEARAEIVRRDAAERERERAARARLAEEARAAADARAREVARAEAERAERAAKRRDADALADRPGPTAALYRGRVNPATRCGQLLLMAPAPGGQAAGCFAEMLRRTAEGRAEIAWLKQDKGTDDDGGETLSRARADLLALSDLYRMADGFYRTLDVPPGEGPPVNGDALRAPVETIGGSISSQLVEG